MKKKHLLTLLAIIFTTFLVIGCSNSDDSDKNADGDKKATEVKTKIQFTGSSTLAPVIQAIADDFTNKYGTWDKVDSALPNKDIEININSGGSGEGAKGVIEGTTDIGMLARGVKDEEKAQITDPVEYLVGIDALTLAVHPENPILTIKDDLTKEEIVKIFSGEYATWKDFDPSLPDEEIIVITRDIGGGAHEVFQEKVMGDVDVKADAIQASSMGALVTKIMENKYAIGYASFGVANQNEGKVVMLKVVGIEPTVENILDGKYIIQRPLILLTSGKLDAAEQAFVDYILGEEGQKLVEEMGFVPAAQ